jgi:hypothetical protein
MFLRFLIAISLLPVFIGLSHADTLTFDLTKPNPDLELKNVPPEAFTPAGLRLKVGEASEASVLSKQSFKGRLIITVDYEIVNTPSHASFILRMDNPEKKRRMDLGDRVVWGKDAEGKPLLGQWSFQRYYKDGKLTAERGHGAPNNRLILIKEGVKIYGAFGVPQYKDVVGSNPEPNSGVISYPNVYFNEDCDEFRVGVAAVTTVDDRSRPMEVLVTRLTVWGPEVKDPNAKLSGPFVPPDLPDEEKVAACGPKVWRFDMGPLSQELESGFIPVNPRTMYTPGTGYGWETNCRPFDFGWEYQRMPDTEAVKLGLWSPASYSEGWRQDWERTSNWMMANKIGAMDAISWGFIHVDYFNKDFDLNTPIERDLVSAFHPYGCTWDHRREADLWELRGAVYVDDDLSTHFKVDLPNDRYSMLVGVGYNGPTLGRGSPFSLEAQGKVVKKGLNDNWRRVNYFKVDDIEVTQGQLDLRIFADRRLAMNRLDPWQLGPSWQLNYLIILPSDAKEDIRREEWKIILDRGEKIRKITFAPGEPLIARVQNDYLINNEKPFIPVLWQFYRPPSTYDHYPYYLWGNTNAMVNIEAIYRASQHFMKGDWFKYSAADDYPWSEIDKMNVSNRQGKVCFVRVDGLLSFIPQAVAGEGGQIEDSRGRTNRWNAEPPLNSRLGREMQREARSMATFQIRRHPSLFGNYIYEERWHPDGQGYDWQSLGQYHEYLLRKYGTVEKLNEEWGTAFKDVGEIKPPPQEQDSANWANFRAFRMWAQVQDIKYAHDLLDVLEPEHVTFGAKGDYPTASWYYAPYINLFSWYTVPTARVPAIKFGQAPGAGGSLFYCPYVWTDGRKQLDHKPGPKHYQGRNEQHTAYNVTLQKFFDGVKGIYCEEYDDSFEHMFHRTKQLKYETAEGLCKKWTGELGFFDEEAYDYPEVAVDENALAFTGAMGLLYRLTPVLCPAKVLKPSVAIYLTDESFFFQGGHSVFATEAAEKILKKLQVPYDLLRDEIFDRLSDYEVLIIGPFSESVRPDRAEKIRQFVQKGGKLIILGNAAMRNAVDLKPGKTAPVFGLSEIAGTKIINLMQRPIQLPDPVTIVANPFTPSFKGGEVLYPECKDCGLKLEPDADAKPLIRCKDVVLAAANKDGTVLTIVASLEQPGWLPAEQRDHDRTSMLTRLFSDFFDRWKPKVPLELSGFAKREEVNAGVLYAPATPGEPGVAGPNPGYWIVGITNNAEAEQKLNVKMTFLPAGKYEVVDVTGERPNIVRKPDRGLALAPDPAHRCAETLAKETTADVLKQQGLGVTIGGYKALVLLIRPAGWKVWQAAPDYAINYLASRPVTVVVGKNAPDAEKKAAEAIRAAVAARGIKAQVVDSSAVSIRKAKHEVWITSQFPGVTKDYKGYLVDTFENEPVQTDDTLVVVGSEATNPLVAHFAKVGTFTYDKILEKVTQAYPGAGRGMIQMVDSVNFPYYDATDNTRDAILVGGSDAAGTALAADQLVSVLKKFPKPWKRPLIPAIPDMDKLPQ